MIKAIDLDPVPTNTPDFADFVSDVEPRLRRAMAGTVGVDHAADAVAEAITYAWANWERISVMENPAGYLYRVARSSSRVRIWRRRSRYRLSNSRRPHPPSGRSATCSPTSSR